MSADPQEVSSSINQVNTLGKATQTLFSRLYNGLRHRSGKPSVLPPNQRQQQLQRAVKSRNAEIQRLRGILAAIDEGVIMQDLDGRIVHVNAAAQKLIGNRKDFWTSELGGLFNAYRDVVTVESELVPLGEPSRIQINNLIVGAQVAAVADDNGNRIGTMIVLRDVTRDALSDRLKDQFVTAISHELRTPMAVIKGMSDIIINQSENNKPPNRRFLETLTRNVDILDRMIVELLDIAEMSAATFTVRRTPINLEELVMNVVKGVTPEVKRAQLEVKVMAKDNERLTIIGDDQRLRWAFGHMLQNAIRYTEPEGHIILLMGLSGQDHVTLQVVDTGVGISKKDLPHIFDRFYRGEPRTRSGKLLDPRGLGQGLFVARTVAESHGGYLTVRSEVGQGSVFTMVLPFSPPESEHPN
jgi:two-component system phosphate regulon sensor histidine kinase PhoR